MEKMNAKTIYLILILLTALMMVASNTLVRGSF